jgi:hypothetical protein
MAINDYVPEEMEFIKEISEKIGPRLPGSAKEKKGAEVIAEDFRKITGNAKIDRFVIHPYAFIGWIPIAGMLAIIAALSYLWIAWIALIISFCILNFVAIQFVKYLQIFDFLFPRAKSQNVFSILEPLSRNVKYTLILSAHLDSSMEWPLNCKNPKNLRYKISFGIGSLGVLLILSLIRTLEIFLGPGLGSGFSLEWTKLFVFPMIFSFLYIINFISWDPKRASPGAMDNLSGIAVSKTIMKYFKDHPEESPKNCRIILAAFGSEEAGLRGSRAFVKKYRSTLLNGDVWVMNVDGVADLDYFNILQGEIMLGVKYDEEFTTFLRNAYERAGVKYGTFYLDVGASDAVTFIRINKKAITFSAQDNTPRENYHTHLDTIDKVDPRAIEKMNEIILDVIHQIDDKMNNISENK